MVLASCGERHMVNLVVVFLFFLCSCLFIEDPNDANFEILIKLVIKNFYLSLCREEISDNSWICRQ